MMSNMNVVFGSVGNPEFINVQSTCFSYKYFNMCHRKCIVYYQSYQGKLYKHDAEIYGRFFLRIQCNGDICQLPSQLNYSVLTDGDYKDKLIFCNNSLHVICISSVHLLT